MGTLSGINDLVIRFANVNGTGSASANTLFAKSIFRMGIPVSPKNIFPSNIQGLPTWYEVRINGDGYLGRREMIDIVVSLNPQSIRKDVDSVREGGYFIYDNSKKLSSDFVREDIHYIGIPMTRLVMEKFTDARKRQLFKNIIYVGALTKLLDMDFEVVKKLVADQFKSKQKLVPPNIETLELGRNYVEENYDCPLPLKVQSIDSSKDSILVDGNTACALGAIYGGATVAAWYPITPSTSVVNAFDKYAKKLRVDETTASNKFAIVQAEDELAAIGMVIGAAWNGARAFTSTSGPGLSLMSEFIGLAYFAEIPTVLIDVQRGGPSTGMPTRTQQSDIISAAYASHGDTKHVLLFPSTPKECFDLTATALDLADRLQTPIIVMSDLDLGMNDNMSEPFEWDENKKYDKGKLLSEEDLENLESFGRYLDVDGDGIPYRAIPGTHPTKGSYFTRGTSKDEFARYTEDGDDYVRNVDRLAKKFDTASKIIPPPESFQDNYKSSTGMLFFGTTYYAALEAMDRFVAQDISIDAMRIKAFPFHEDINHFIENHNEIIVVEQNRDAQMRTLIMNELEVDPKKLIKVLNYDGKPITAGLIESKIKKFLFEKSKG
jgi:2-oxoglutarate ferredoxin oxidoreductase subunit alpha